ncbi:MAG: hypothetical protein IH948_00695 [Bacteroidetes bacterium]|nr:hypothetical protein [Bacteroidota bacterium]
MVFAASLGGVQEVLADGESPRTFSARADEVISGGQYVVAAGGANAIGSTSADFIPGSLVVSILADSDYVNGIALNNVGSNGVLSVATRGTYIATAAGVISGGHKVFPISGTVQGVIGDPARVGDKSHYSGTHIGRSLMPAASGTNKFVLVDFNFS